MKVRGTDFVLYHVTDMERSIAFYTETLGLSAPERPIPQWVEFDVPPTTLALYCSEEEGMPSGGRGASIALAVDDLVQGVESLRSQGVPVLFGPIETPVCWMAVIADPDGNPVTLHQRKDGSFG